LRGTLAAHDDVTCGEQLVAAFRGPETRPAVFPAFLTRMRMSPDHDPVVRAGEIATLPLPAEVDVTNAQRVLEDLTAALGNGAKVLIADMSATTFCDSAGVAALVHARQKAVANQARLRIVTQSPAVQRVLSLTSVDTLIPVFPTLDDAQAAG
jgi:anti-sigma B factor antagonist